MLSGKQPFSAKKYEDLQDLILSGTFSPIKGVSDGKKVIMIVKMLIIY